MKTSIERVGYALITKDEATQKYIAGDINWFVSEESGGREFEAQPKGELTEIYADGKLVKAVEINDGYTIKLILIDIIDDVSRDWLGFTVGDDKSIAEYADNKQRPKFSLVTVESKDDGSYEMTSYYKCQVYSRPKRASKTSEGKFDPLFSEFEIVAKPREDKLVRYTTILSDLETLPTTISEPVT